LYCIANITIRIRKVTLLKNVKRFIKQLYQIYQKNIIYAGIPLKQKCLQVENRLEQSRALIKPNALAS